MFNQSSKDLCHRRFRRKLGICAAFVGLLAPAWLAGQDKPAAAQPQYKDPAEYTLYSSILADTNPKDQTGQAAGMADQVSHHRV